jgi:hypothetical protein
MASIKADFSVFDAGGKIKVEFSTFCHAAAGAFAVMGRHSPVKCHALALTRARKA